MERVRLTERKALLRRYFLADKDLISLARKLGVGSVEGKTYLLSDEARTLIETIAASVSDSRLVEAFSDLSPKRAFEMPDFRGQYYVVRDAKLRLDGAEKEVKRNVFDVLDNVKTEEQAFRRYAFLLSLATLCSTREDYWLHYWDGPPLREVIRKMDEILGRTGIMPAPQDYLILSAYGLYTKGGSNKYPAHCMPIEIIPTVLDALTEWQRRHPPTDRKA